MSAYRSPPELSWHEATVAHQRTWRASLAGQPLLIEQRAVGRVVGMFDNVVLVRGRDVEEVKRRLTKLAIERMRHL